MVYRYIVRLSKILVVWIYLDIKHKNISFLWFRRDLSVIVTVRLVLKGLAAHLENNPTFYF